MYILTNKNNVIIAISKTLDYQENGNPLLEDRTGFIYAYGKRPDEVINVCEVAEVPEEMVEQKYCYTQNDGFTLNPNYVEPEKEITNQELMEQITDLQLALAELVEEGLE